MSTPLESYKRFLLNRTTITPAVTECIESSLCKEDESLNQYFHKVVVHNWHDSIIQLFDILSEHLTLAILPVNAIVSHGEWASFYTSSLNVILKIIKFDFMLPFSRMMFTMDVIVCDKTSKDLFNSVTTIDQIVSSVVCRRFNEHCQLDLSNFCEDPEFLAKKIWFYKLVLLAQFKILMLRMGRDTRRLILRNNNLSQAPAEILNFFIKADLTAIDLSYNNIPSIQELYRVSSKIEELWVEGNPLCEELDPITYVKAVSVKFPRLVELDGIKFNQHGLLVPFFRNYIVTPDKKTKTIVEEFITQYFSNFDHRLGNKKVGPFYAETATLTISADFNDFQAQLLRHYGQYHRNFLDPQHKLKYANKLNYRMYKNHINIMGLYSQWPVTVHDQSTFSVDVICHSSTALLLNVDGVYKELIGPGNETENILHFRRTFYFSITRSNNKSIYSIQHEMLNVRFASKDQINNSFKVPILNTRRLTLVKPTIEETTAMTKAFQHITLLKKSEAELRLKFHCWNIQAALREFTDNVKDNKVTADRFASSQELTDLSSESCDELD